MGLLVSECPYGLTCTSQVRSLHDKFKKSDVSDGLFCFAPM